MTARGGGGRGRGRTRVAAALAVAALAAVPGRAGAQNLEQYDYANLGLRAVGVEALFVDPSQNEATVGFGVKLDLGFLGPNVRVIPRFAYWKADVDPDRVEELERQLEEVSELPAGSINLGDIRRAAYIAGFDLQYINNIGSVSPYVGAGLDVYVLNDDGAAIEGTFLDDAIVTAGLSAVGGLQLALTPNVALFGEVRGTAVTDASSFGGAAGIYFLFGN